MRVLSTQIVASQAERRDGAGVRRDDGAGGERRRRARCSSAGSSGGARTRSRGRGASRATRAALAASRARCAPVLAAALVIAAGAAARDGGARLLRARRRVDDAGAAARVHARQLPAPGAPTASSGSRSRNSVSMALDRDGREHRRLLRRRVSASCCAASRARGCSQLLVALPWAIPGDGDRDRPRLDVRPQRAAHSCACCSSARSGFCRSRTSSAAFRS